MNIHKGIREEPLALEGRDTLLGDLHRISDGGFRLGAEPKGKVGVEEWLDM